MASSSSEDAVEDAEDTGFELGFLTGDFVEVTGFLKTSPVSSSELLSRGASRASILERGVSGVPGGGEILPAKDGDRGGEEAIGP